MSDNYEKIVELKSMNYELENIAQQLREQNELFKLVLRVLIEQLPNHTVDCGVHNSHPNYGNQHCNCKNQELREAVRKKL
jgi:hypothetical protein